MPKRDENREWRRFKNGELHSLYRSSSIVQKIKPGWKKVGLLQERDLQEGLGLCGRTVLEWIFRNVYQFEELDYWRALVRSALKLWVPQAMELLNQLYYGLHSVLYTNAQSFYIRLWVEKVSDLTSSLSNKLFSKKWK